jgi:hypothetical protein
LVGKPASLVEVVVAIAFGRRNVTFADASKKRSKACATKAIQTKPVLLQQRRLFFFLKRLFGDSGAEAFHYL